MSARHHKIALAVLTVLATCAGCVALREYQCNAMTKLRGHSAYHRMACPPACASVARHYERGWKQGYYDVAKGGEGCAPPLPPEQYLSFMYQCPKGEAAIHSWYRGYQDGAHAAFAEGVQSFNYVPSPAMPGPAVHQAPVEVIEASPDVAPQPQAMAPPARSESASGEASFAATEPATVEKPLKQPPLDYRLSQSTDQRGQALRENPLRPRATEYFGTASARR